MEKKFDFIRLKIRRSFSGIRALFTWRIPFHWHPRNVFLNDDEEDPTGDCSNDDEGHQDDINKTEEGRQKREKFVRFFFQNAKDPLKLMAIFNYFQIIQQRRLTFYWISYQCNSSNPMTFVEIRLYAIVILLQYLLIMFVACSTFFSRTASNKVNIRG